MSELLCTAALRKEADEHQTVFEEDRRRKALFYASAEEIDRLRKLIAEVVKFDDCIALPSMGDNILPTKLLRELRACCVEGT